jgi:hypothetical protein
MSNGSVTDARGDVLGNLHDEDCKRSSDPTLRRLQGLG